MCTEAALSPLLGALQLPSVPSVQRNQDCLRLTELPAYVAQHIPHIVEAIRKRKQKKKQSGGIDREASLFDTGWAQAWLIADATPECDRPSALERV